MDAVDLSPDLQFLVQSKNEQGRADQNISGQESGRSPARLRYRRPGELVSGARDRFGERGSGRWKERSWRFSRCQTPDAAMDAADHCLRRALDQRTGGTRLAGGDQITSAKLDWEKRRRRDRFQDRQPRSESSRVY